MTQISLLDSRRLSSLLRDALSWNDNISSLLVSAKNGSILAYAFRGTAPSIKALRTMSTTLTAAYSVASEDTLVFESQNSCSLSVITSVADHLLLAVSSSDGHEADRSTSNLYSVQPQEESEPTEREGLEEDQTDGQGEESRKEQLRKDLETVCEELAGILRDELAGMKWPEDI